MIFVSKSVFEGNTRKKCFCSWQGMGGFVRSKDYLHLQFLSCYTEVWIHYTKIPSILLSNLPKFLYAAELEMGSFWWKRKRRNLFISLLPSLQIVSVNGTAIYMFSSEENTERNYNF